MQMETCTFFKGEHSTQCAQCFVQCFPQHFAPSFSLSSLPSSPSPSPSPSILTITPFSSLWSSTPWCASTPNRASSIESFKLWKYHCLLNLISMQKSCKTCTLMWMIMIAALTLMMAQHLFQQASFTCTSSLPSSNTQSHRFTPKATPKS